MAPCPRPLKSVSAAQRRAAAPLLLGAGARRCCARGALSSKPAACRSGCTTMRQTDGHATVTQTLHRNFFEICCYTGSIGEHRAGLD